MKTVKNNKKYNFTDKQKRSDNHRTAYNMPTASFKKTLNDRFDAKCKQTLIKMRQRMKNEDYLFAHDYEFKEFEFPIFVKNALWNWF